MKHSAANVLVLTICFLALCISFPRRTAGKTAVPHAENLLADADFNAFIPFAPANYPQVPCLPLFANDQLLLTITTEAALERMAAADLNGDGWPDVVIARIIFQSATSHEISILLNDRHGGLYDGTQTVFNDPPPAVQHPTRLLLHDFNGDSRPDIFISDLGMDAPPFPGYQNSLVLSAPGGKLIDATDQLPQQADQSHSAAAADIDRDGDIDLFIGNLGGSPPQIWLNDGNGNFTVGSGLLPAAQENLSQNWYTSSQFADVNLDAFPDLVLGQGNPHQDSHLLINDGSGQFTLHPTPLPPTIFAPNQQPIDIKSADINDDAYPDLLITDTRSSYVGRYIQLLINNGDNTFRDETAGRLPQTYDDGWWRQIDLLDINYDGHLDFVAKAMSGPHLFYLHDAQGGFNAWDPGIDLYEFVFLEFDGDGRRDILLSGSADPGVNDQEWHAIIRHNGCQNP